MVLPDLDDIDFNALALGFHLPGLQDVKVDYHELLRSDNDWKIVAGILFACREGNFEHLGGIIDVLQKTDGYLIWCACINIVGYAGTSAMIEDTVDAINCMSTDSENDEFVAMLLGTSCDLRAVDRLLELYTRTEELDVLRDIQVDLSSFLENHDGKLIEGFGDTTELPSLNERQRYTKLVDDQRNVVLETLPNPLVPVFEGRALDIIGTAHRMLALLDRDGDYPDRLIRQKMIFEASTGTDCSAVFDSVGRLQRMEAVAVLEEFFDTVDANKYKIGQRYFFGHPIPL